MTKTPEQIERAYAVLDHIEKHPDLHNQGAWTTGALTWKIEGFAAEDMTPECGTTACFAGWTVLLNGDTMVGSLVPAINYQHVADHAANLLDLDGSEQTKLFYIADSLDAVRSAVTEIFGPRPSGLL